MFDLVLRGDRTDIAIEDGLIAAIGPGLGGGKHEIDAAGLAVLPGLIDIHLHFNEPGRTEWEGAATGSRALAAGGGTLFFDMPLNSTPCTVNGREFDRKAEALTAASITDFALWGGIVPGNCGALAELAGRGVVGLKHSCAIPDSKSSRAPTTSRFMRRCGRPRTSACQSPCTPRAKRSRRG